MAENCGHFPFMFGHSEPPPNYEPKTNIGSIQHMKWLN